MATPQALELPIRSPMRPDPDGSYQSVFILPDLPSSHDIYQRPLDPLVTIGRRVYPEDSFFFPPSGHNTLSSQTRLLNHELAAAGLGYHCDPAPGPIFSEEATIPDSIMSHHSQYDYPSDFEHDLPELISRPNDSDRTAGTILLRTTNAMCGSTTTARSLTSTSRTWAHSGWASLIPYPLPWLSKASVPLSCSSHQISPSNMNGGSLSTQ
jgi:hypothetical protein